MPKRLLYIPPRLVRRVGRRGAFLQFLAMVAGIYTYGLLTRPARESPLLMFAVAVAPIWVWVAAWGTAGVVCAVTSFLRQDRAGFACIGAVAVAWGLLALGGSLTGVVERGYLSAAIWLGVAGLAYIVSTWPEYNGE